MRSDLHPSNEVVTGACSSAVNFDSADLMIFVLSVIVSLPPEISLFLSVTSLKGVTTLVFAVSTAEANTVDAELFL